MPSFPKTEAEIVALALAMLGGYQAQPGLFPHADRTGLDAARAAFEARRDEQVAALARAAAATQAKQAALDALVRMMKTQLRQSEADTADAPQSLDHIGWGARQKGRASGPPGQPLGLVPSAEGEGTVTLSWKAPAPGSGGRVRTYVIERRDRAPGGPGGDWCQAGIALGPRAVLAGQPCGVPMEYRVIAVNLGGSSAPSNTAAVVL